MSSLSSTQANNTKHASSKVIVALDFEQKQDALSLIEQLSPNDCRLKIGKEMFTHFGPEFVRYVVDLGFDVFLDLKFHDIPNTVAKACKAAANLGVWMVNVHASGGLEMMEAAVKELSQFGEKRPLLTAVTVLTSMNQSQMTQVIGERSINEQVLNLAMLAQTAGIDGVVCSAKEAVMLRESVNTQFKLVTPGIRPAGADTQDQKRVVTPQQALKDGVDYLVMGRPITQADDPKAVLTAINESLLSL